MVYYSASNNTNDHSWTQKRFYIQTCCWISCLSRRVFVLFGQWLWGWRLRQHVIETNLFQYVFFDLPERFRTLYPMWKLVRRANAFDWGNIAYKIDSRLNCTCLQTHLLSFVLSSTLSQHKMSFPRKCIVAASEETRNSLTLSSFSFQSLRLFLFPKPEHSTRFWEALNGNVIIWFQYTKISFVWFFP